MTLVKNYRRVLNERIELLTAAEFKIGTHDCCIFTASCIEAITGINYFAPFAGKYNDYDSAVAALRGLGYNSLFDFLTRTFGPARPIHEAKCGFIPFVIRPDGPTIGVCVGQMTAYAGGYGLTAQFDGVIFEQTELATRVFRTYG